MLRDQLILSPDPVGQLVHIGAGLCDALETYQDAGPDNIILIEPNPEALDDLRVKTKTYGNVELIPAAISDTAGRAHLRVLNFADLSSLRMPTDLIDLLPGVRIVSEPMVDTLTFEALCDRLPKVSKGKSNWLIIEAPGEELAIAKALSKSGNRDLFQNILIRCGQSAYFEGGSAAPEVLQILRADGYQLENSWVGDDPDWPYFHLSLDVVALENTQLKAETASMQAQLSDLEIKLAAAQEINATTVKDLQEKVKTAQAEKSNLAIKLAAAAAAMDREKEAATAKQQELQAKLDTQAKEQAATKSALEAKLTEATAATDREKEAATAKQQELQAKLDTQAKEQAATKSALEAKLIEATAATDREKDAATAKQQELQVKLDTQAKEQATTKSVLEARLLEATAATSLAQETGATAVEDQQKQAETARAETSAVEAKLAEATAAANHAKEAAAVKLHESQTKLDTQAKEQATARKNLETKLQKQEETLKKDLGVALRLQMLARNDHQDLQTRYSDLQDEKRQQEELLIKLTQKLGNAAGYLRQLNEQGGEMELSTEPLETAKPVPTAARSKKKSTRK